MPYIGIVNYCQNYLNEHIMNDDNITTIDITGFGGAGQPSYTYNVGAGGLSGSSGVDTITIDSSLYSSGSLTSASTSTIAWNQSYPTWTTGTNTAVNISTDGISMQPGTDIKIGGRGLMDAIDKIEERLGILHPNPDLEDRWDELKDLRRKYNELEKDLLEKEKMWKILKEK
jgi:hypothetical protein